METNDDAAPTLSSAIPTLMEVALTPTSEAVSGAPFVPPLVAPVVPVAPPAAVVPPAPGFAAPVVPLVPGGMSDGCAPGAWLEPVATPGRGAPVVEVLPSAPVRAAVVDGTCVDSRKVRPATRTPARTPATAG